MRLSLSETRALAVKASRGAGLGWGLAEEAGQAAEWLAAAGHDALGAVAGWLEARGQGCPVAAGVALCDAPPEGPRDLGALVWPVLLVPFLWRLSVGLGREALLAWPGGVASPADPAALVRLPRGPVAVSLRLSPRRRAPPPPSRGPRPDVADSVIDLLEALALRTCVPPSARSRAGAGGAGSDSE